MTAVDDRRATATPSAHRNRRPEEIERDIRATRARMDAALDEIEYRLSPGQVTGGVVELVRDVAQGRPTRTARAIRANPVPVALIAIGAIWLAWGISRTPRIEARRVEGAPALVSDQRTRILLTGLAGTCRQGAAGVREADLAIPDADLSPRLREAAGRLDRSAGVLERELEHRGGAPDREGPLHPAWQDLRGAIGRKADRAAILSSVERGLDGALALFRDALHEPLPEDLRVVVGAQFHEVETVRHRVTALRETVG